MSVKIEHVFGGPREQHYLSDSSSRYIDITKLFKTPNTISSIKGGHELKGNVKEMRERQTGN